MIRLFFLIPLLMCAVWYWYLKNNNYTVKDGLRGFTYIFVFNGVIISFFVLMLFLTN